MALSFLLIAQHQLCASLCPGKDTAVSSSAADSTSSRSKLKLRYQDLPLETRQYIFKFVGPDQEGWLPLQKAASNPNPELTRFFIACGADVNEATVANESNWISCLINTPLSFTARLCDYVHDRTKMRKGLVVFNILLRHGADKNKPGECGNAPLHAAVESHNLPIMQSLIAAGANLDVKNRWNKTPLDLARNNAMNQVANVPLRKTMYEFSAILQAAGAPSSVTLEPMPTDEVMQAQHVQAIAQMERERRQNMFQFGR